MAYGHYTIISRNACPYLHAINDGIVIDHAPIDQNILHYAEFKEELHAIIQSMGHGKATMKYIVFCAPLFEKLLH